MTAIDVPDLAALDAAVAQAPDRPAVFLVWGREGRPYLGRTALLRRRLRRLLGERPQPSRILNLRQAARRIEYELAGSRFESAVRLYELAREHFPDTYLDVVKLRLPAYVKVGLSNPFPRLYVTTQLGRAGAWFGPFPSRGAAERFEGETLDLFQVRRCQEDLEPSPSHPGCIYGEMGMCLRPCQQVVGADEYAHEVARVVEFLATGGRSLEESIGRARDRLSAELAFEEAARQHKRLEKVRQVIKLADELARDVNALHGVAVTPSTGPNAVELWLVRSGWWLGRRRLDFEVREGKPVSLDGSLRELLADTAVPRLSVKQRQEYLALLARWFYSSWREGEWVAVDDFDRIPYRRLVQAVSRVAHAAR